MKIKVDIVFVFFVAIATFLLMYLIYNVLQTIQHIYEIVRLFSLLILPLPIALYVGFIYASRKIIHHENTNKDKIVALLLFFTITIFIVILTNQYDRLSAVNFGEMKIVPLFMSTLITAAYVLNYLTSKNLKVSAVLSGLLLGLAIYFFI